MNNIDKIFCEFSDRRGITLHETRQALYKAIIEDERWPNKKIRVKKLMELMENNQIKDHESALAEILGVEPEVKR